MQLKYCFFSLTNNSVTRGLNFSLDSISAIISSNTFKPNLRWFYGVRFEVEVGAGGAKLPCLTPCLKLVRVMLETSFLARNYTQICSSEKIPFSTKAG